MRRLGLLVLGLLLMLGGLQVGTQWSAPMVPRPDRGPAWVQFAGYPIYRPYQGLVWFVMADDAVLGSLLWPTGLTVAAVACGVLVLRSSVGSRRRHRPDQRISGARWATREDLCRGGLL